MIIQNYVKDYTYERDKNYSNHTNCIQSPLNWEGVKPQISIKSSTKIKH